jgi:hypothetical protein
MSSLLLIATHILAYISSMFYHIFGFIEYSSDRAKFIQIYRYNISRFSAYGKYAKCSPHL